MTIFNKKVQIWGSTRGSHLAMYDLKLSKNSEDAGIDLYPDRIIRIDDIPGWIRYTVGTGVHMHFPKSVFGRLIHRSSSFAKLNGGLVQDGTIDSGYIGELFVIVNALIEYRATVHEGIEKCINDKVALAQIVVSPFIKPKFELKEIFDTGRGKDGFGSTDVLK